jgi:hypothetical protein
MPDLYDTERVFSRLVIVNQHDGEEFYLIFLY